MDIATARTFFPGTQNQVFLDAACVSLMPVQAEQALRGLGQELLSCPARDASAHHIALDRTAPPVREEAAKLIGAAAEDIALIESTTQGLQIIAASLPLKRGEKILIGATEFMGVAVPWIGSRDRDDFEIETVSCPDGRVRVDDFARAADGKTRMILLSSVQWNTGYRADLAGFSEFTRQRNIVLVVDAIQQLGAMPLNVSQTPVDFLVTGGHKWLNAPAGRGFLYVAPRMQERCRPPAWGYLNIAEPPVGWANYFATPEIPAVRPYDFVGGARRFEVGGTANYPGNVVLAASLRLINELGKDAIASHIMSLTDQLIEGLRSTGATVISPPEPAARSGIVTFTLGDSAERDRACLQRLLDRRILISQRYTAGIGGLRVSVHFFNNREDVERMIEAVKTVKSELGEPAA